MAFLNVFKDGMLVINGLPKIGKSMYERKVVPGRIFNPAENGYIFVRHVKPFGRILHKLKEIGVPPTVVVAVFAGIAVVGIGYGAYKVVKVARRE